MKDPVAGVLASLFTAFKSVSAVISNGEKQICRTIQQGKASPSRHQNHFQQH